MALLLDEVSERKAHQDLPAVVPAPNAVVRRPAAELAGLAGDDDVLHRLGSMAGWRVFAAADGESGCKTGQPDPCGGGGVHVLFFIGFSVRAAVGFQAKSVAHLIQYLDLSSSSRPEGDVVKLNPVVGSHLELELNAPPNGLLQ